MTPANLTARIRRIVEDHIKEPMGNYEIGIIEENQRLIPIIDELLKCVEILNEGTDYRTRISDDGRPWRVRSHEAIASLTEFVAKAEVENG